MILEMILELRGKGRLVYLTLALCGLQLIVTRAEAGPELYNCNGVIRNLPCGTSAAPVPAEEAAKISSSKATLSEKRSLIHNLTMRSLEAKDQYDLQFDIGAAREVCNQASSSVEDCRTEVDKISAVIAEQSTAAKLVKEKQTANKLQEDANELQEERNTIEANTPNVTIIDQRPIIVRPRPRPHHHRSAQGVAIDVGIR